MAEKKKITKRVISKVGAPAPKEVEKVIEAEKVEKVERAEGTESNRSVERVDKADVEGKGIRAKKVCFFCQSKSTPTYTDLVILRKFLSDRAKIVPKLRSGLCARHQRTITKQIKYARHLSLLPFVPKV